MSGMFDNNLEDDNGEDQQAKQEAEAIAKVRKIKTIRIYAHAQDRTNLVAKDEHRHTIADVDGYVPSCIGIGGGDYVDLVIDIETGQIQNWVKPADDDLIEAFKLLK